MSYLENPAWPPSRQSHNLISPPGLPPHLAKIPSLLTLPLQIPHPLNEGFTPLICPKKPISPAFVPAFPRFHPASRTLSDDPLPYAVSPLPLSLKKLTCRTQKTSFPSGWPYNPRRRVHNSPAINRLACISHGI